MCYISDFAIAIDNMLAARGLERPPSDLIEPVTFSVWELGRQARFAERARMQAVAHTTSRAFGAFFENWDVFLTPITALPTLKVGAKEYLTISDNPPVQDWFVNQFRFYAARQSLRNPWRRSQQMGASLEGAAQPVLASNARRSSNGREIERSRGTLARTVCL